MAAVLVGMLSQNVTPWLVMPMRSNPAMPSRPRPRVWLEAPLTARWCTVPIGNGVLVADQRSRTEGDSRSLADLMRKRGGEEMMQGTLAD